MQNYIGGGYRAANNTETFDNINPATGETIAEVEIALGPEIEAAITTAQAGFRQWAAMSGVERGRVLNTAARLLREHNQALAEMEVNDTGKPIQEAEVVDVASGADCLEYFAGVAGSLRGEQIALNNAFVYTRREPHRRVRWHRLVELSDPDRLLEGCARACLRQRHDLQDLGTDAIDACASG